MSDRLLTGAEVAQWLNMPVATLRYWRHVGEGPPSFRLGPRRVMYRERDVEQWLEGNTAPNRPQPQCAVPRSLHSAVNQSRCAATNRRSATQNGAERRTRRRSVNYTEESS